MPEMRAWSVTFGLGTLSGGRFTEIRVPASFPPEDQEELVRAAAHDLYGRAWAFEYPPEAFAEAIARYGLTVRETVDLDERSEVLRFGDPDEPPHVRLVRAGAR